MKQKILIIALLFCMIFTMASCSGNNHEKIATVTIEEEKYVLSGDFQEVVGTMVKNGLEVRDRIRLLAYDEEGMFSTQKKMEIGVDYLWATEHVYSDEWNGGTLLYSEFEIDGNEFDFETKLGITSDSKKKDIEELEGFIRADINKGFTDTYSALYVNGDMVDFSDYEDDYEDWIEHVKQNGIYAGMNDPYQMGEGFDMIIVFYKKSGITDIDEFIERFDKAFGDDIFKGIVVLQLALNDALKMMEEGEVETCSIVGFAPSRVNEKDIVMFYKNYYFDPD